MTIPQSKKKFATWVCVLAPVYLLVVYVAMAIHIRVGLGHWPKPMVEDYHSVLFQVHKWLLVGCIFFAVFAAIPVWVLLLCFRAFRITLRIHVAQLGIFVLGWLLIFLAAYFDPTTFTDWFLD
jgi:hypothetical protein